MTIELRIPSVGESIQEVQIAEWLKREGDTVSADETVAVLDTDKASVDLPAPAQGVITKIFKKAGEQVAVGEVIASFEPGVAASKSSSNGANAAPPAPSPADAPHSIDADATNATLASKSNSTDGSAVATPSARRELRRHGLTASDVSPSGDRVTPEDVRRHLKSQEQPAAPAKPSTTITVAPVRVSDEVESSEEIVPMSMIRRRIAERLVSAQHQAALLTTFNEIDMTAVMDLRKRYGERFKDRYGVKLGFMSFFVKATIDALEQHPEINAEIRDDKEIVFRRYYHIGIAIGGGKGLVVPILRHAERMSFAEIELTIADFAARAEKNRLKPEELEGGTFTISNGGVYGSLLSTPIVNPPQSGVLGLHTIQERPVARDGQVVIRPMMYLALTYDHRIIDGRGAVTFLKRIVDTLQEPSRILLEV